MSNMTQNQMKILYLISKMSGIQKRNRNIIWLKELPLLTLIYEGIKEGIFEGYDYAPYLVTLQGVKQYANVSQEYLKEIDSLINQGFVLKLKLSTKYYDNINAFSVSTEHNKTLEKIPEYIKKQVDRLISCPGCNSIIDVLITERIASIVCPECSFSRESDFFKLEDIPYHSVAYFSEGGR